MDPDDLARTLASERRQAFDSTLQCALRTLADRIGELGLELPAGFECCPGNRCRGCREKLSAHQAEQFQLLRQHTNSEWRRHRSREWHQLRAERAAAARHHRPAGAPEPVRLWSPGGSALRSNEHPPGRRRSRRRRRRRPGARSPTPGRFPWDGLPFVPAPPGTRPEHQHGAPEPPSAEPSAEPTRKDKQH